MRLTWKGAVSTVFMAAIVIIYVAFLNSTTAWLISSTRGTAAAVLVLGMVGGCAMSAAAGQYQGTQARAYTGLASVLGATALVAGGDRADHREHDRARDIGCGHAHAVAGGNGAARFTPAAVRCGSRDTHEVIHPEKTGH